MKRTIHFLFSLFLIVILFNSSCANISNPNDNANHSTGPLICGVYEFNTYAEADEFYKIYGIKNSEKFLLINVDSPNYTTKYRFISNGINILFLNKKKYNIIYQIHNFKYFFNILKIKILTELIVVL